jgi:hypothetical protein
MTGKGSLCDKEGPLSILSVLSYARLKTRNSKLTPSVFRQKMI